MNEILFGKVLRFALEEVIWIGTSPEKSGILRLASPEGTGQLAGYLVDIACPKIPKLGELLARYTFFTFEILLPVLEKQSNSRKGNMNSLLRISPEVIRYPSLSRESSLFKYCKCLMQKH